MGHNDRTLGLERLPPTFKWIKKEFPKFLGNGKVTTDEHIKAFFAATDILGVGHEDVAVRLFMETLTDSAADWFYHLDDGSIIGSDTLRTTFEDRFKTVEDEHALLRSSQL